MAYDYVTVFNSTNYPGSGTVEYDDQFCSNDDWNAGPGNSWTATSRGYCLVTGVTATLNVNGTPIAALGYSSPGTSASYFVVVQKGTGIPPTFQVLKASDGADDVRPADYKKPTTQQK